MTFARSLLAFAVLLMSSSISLQSQVATNTSAATAQSEGRRALTAQETEYLRLQGIDPSNMTYDTNKACFCRPPTAEEAEWYRSQGIDPKGILISYADSHQQSPQGPPATPATPTDLKNAFIWMDNFMGTTNATIAADVISMKAQSLTFFVFGHNYDYSGNYTVMINKPREHKKPLFGFGSPETASLVMLEDFGGDAMPLTNVIIWEKSKDFLDVVAIGKEWIYSGPYTLQKP